MRVRPASFGEIQPGTCGSRDDPERGPGGRTDSVAYVAGRRAEDPVRKMEREQGAVGARGLDRRAEDGERLLQHRERAMEVVEVLSDDLAVRTGSLAFLAFQEGVERQLRVQFLYELEQQPPAAPTQQRYQSRHRFHDPGFRIRCFFIQFERLAGVVL